MHLQLTMPVISLKIAPINFSRGTLIVYKGATFALKATISHLYL